MIRSLKKADLLLFAFFLLLAALFFVLPYPHSGSAASQKDTGQIASGEENGAETDSGTASAKSRQMVRVLYGGELIGLYPLDRDEEIEILRKGHRNLVIIQNGTVRMEESDCKNQICVNTGTISLAGELIVCLPNQVIVEIVNSGEGGEENEGIDALVR